MNRGLLILLFTTLCQAMPGCTKGCLKCDVQKSECLFCDFTNRYFLIGGTCEQREIENCLTYTYEGNCQTCASKFFPLNGVCEEFVGEIQNCEVYENSTDCLYCATGFHNDGGVCVAVEEEILNCKYYSPGGGTCEQCQEGTFLYIDKRYCIYLEAFEGCGVWSQIWCKNCVDGFYYDPNASLRAYFHSLSPANAAAYITAVLTQNGQNFVAKSCIQTSVQYCEEFQDFETCLKCQQGYILVNNTCFSSRSSQFQTCISFNSENVCVNCAQGFFLNDGECVTIERIPYCLQYDSQATISLCTLCEDEYYLDQNTNSCKRRNQSRDIVNCSKLKFNVDQCEECEQGFKITGDGLKCLAELEGCEIYKPSSIYSNQLHCFQCGETLFYDANQKHCVEGSTQNCQNYQPLYDECKICKQGFYLNQEKNCVEHSLKDIFSCAKLSNSRDNYCDSCDSNSIRVTNRNLCREIKTVILYCSVYKTDKTCEKCQKGYRPTQDQTSCEPIPITNCEIFQDDTTCLKCFDYEAEDYRVPHQLNLDKNQCLVPDLTQFKHCNSIAFSSEKPYCMACKQNYYPKQLPMNHRICVATNFWQLTNFHSKEYFDLCEIYDYLSQQCIKCKNGKLLSQGNCVDTCPVGEGYFLREVYKEYSKNVVVMKRQHYCDAAGTLDNCAIFDFSVKSTDNQYSGDTYFGCIRCKVGYSAVIDPLNEEQHGQYSNYHEDTTLNGYLNRYPFITKCVLTTDIEANLLDVDASVDNCEYFIETSDNKFGCFSCAFGYSDVHFERADYQIYYLKNCTIISGCDNTIKHRALFNPFFQPMLKYSFSKFPMSFYASCHQCTNPNHLVFFGISGGGAHNDNSQSVPLGYLSKFSLTTDPPYVGNDATQTLCSEPDTEFNIPSNCAIVQVVADYQRKGYELVDGVYEALYDSGYVCVTCKPGYAPAYQSSGKIISCTEITNCSQKMFNGCQQCENGFVFGYSDLEERVLTSKCVENSLIDSCYAGVISNGSFYCRQCMKGFSLNLDGECDDVVIEHCLEKTFVKGFSLTQQNPRIQEPFEFIMLNNPSGCIQCEEGFVATTLTEDVSRQFCLLNRKLKATGETLADNFVLNCLSNYKDLATGKIRCKQCEDGLLLVSGTCVQIQVDSETLQKVGECETFNYYTRRCDICKSGYFLNSGVCYKGFIPNCEEFESISKCRRCASGFVVLTLNSEKAICFEISDQFKCSEWSLSASELGELECLTCQDGFFPDYNNFNIPPFLCFSINAVENCAVHDIRYDVRISTFDCLACLPDFFLIQNFCIPRHKTENCLTYHLDRDACANCETGYFLDENEQCLPSLSVSFAQDPCELFFDQDRCLQCSPGYYLDNETCVEVLKADKIPHCLYYRARSECERCSPGYYLIDDSCQIALAKNCITYQSLSKCKDCPEGYGYKQDGDLLHCESIELPNCRTHNPDVFFPFECLVCAQHFYLTEEKQCAPVANIIQYCDIYQDEFHCEQCEQQKALSEAKDGCFSSVFILNKTDESCHQSFLESVPQCQICGFGYYFKGGSCQQCLIKTPQLGCMLCNPEDEYECLICMPNYYMNTKGSCIRISIELDSEPELEKVPVIAISAWLLTFLVF